MEKDEATALVALLKASAKSRDLCKGTRVHDTILKKGFLDKCSDALVIMYAKCGALGKAKELFDLHISRDVLTWTILMSAYAEKGQGQNALDCFEEMQHAGLSPDAVTYTCVLKACGIIGDTRKGVRFHEEIAKQGLLQDNVVLGTALVDMYAKGGALSNARRVLEELPVRNVISWTALITGYAQQGEGVQALNCFERMLQDGIFPNVVTFISLLKACGSIGEVEKGERVHVEITKQGLMEGDVVLGTALLDMYAKCGAMDKAVRVFEDLPTRNAISWTSLIVGYTQHGKGAQALKCFDLMQLEGLSPSSVTLICVLKACGRTKELDVGKKIHDEIANRGLLANNIVLGNALVDMYAKCGALMNSKQVLLELPVRDSITWNALIAGYAEQGEGEEALRCYEGMQREGLSPNLVTFTCILKACGSIRAGERGEKIHDEISKHRLLGNDTVLGTALVDMYVKCGALTRARQVFDELHVRNVFSWTALIAGYAQEGEGGQALKCFERMQRDGLSPNAVTFTCILKAIGSIGAADKGEKIHGVIAKQGLLGNDSVLGNALVDMYAKCGALTKARRVLEKLPFRSVLSWNTLITGYALQCDGSQVLNCFEQMLNEGITPNAVTFSCMLNTCSRLGLVEDAQTLLLNMSRKYGTKADFEHYACMVDLFGRAGHLEKAAGSIERSCSSMSVVWSVLLGACEKWGDVNVGRWAFEHAVDVDMQKPISSWPTHVEL